MPSGPARGLVFGQAEIRLVDQGSRRQGLAGAALGGKRRREPAQLGVQDGQQFRCRLRLVEWRVIAFVAHGAPLAVKEGEGYRRPATRAGLWRQVNKKLSFHDHRKAPFSDCFASVSEQPR
jgi:hypothetical protein